jgi:hypothetical protein
MEGIMNLPANVGGATSQDGLDSFAPLIAAQQAARDMGYPRFTRELLSAGAEMDQAEVQEFLQTIRDAGLTSEDVALMRRVVEAVFGDPNNYPEVRARLLREGVPEDILPETFDLEFFVALRMAVEEAENLSQEPRPTGQEMPMDMPLQMAEGGIVRLPQMTPIAREMAAMGRNGDTMLAHLTPQEAMMLQRMGGSGTINPYTGLPEFFLKKLFKGIGKAIKGVARGIKKFAKSTVGRVVLSIALGAFLGPMATGFLTGAGVTVSAAAAAGITAGVGVFGSSLLAGDGFKNSLRNGLTAGALSFGVAGVTQGFSTPATDLPANLTRGYEQGIANIKEPFQAAADFVRGGPDAAANVSAPAVSPVGDATAQLGQGPQGLTGNEYFQGSGGAGFSTEEINKNILNRAVKPELLDYSDQFAGPQSQLPPAPGASTAPTSVTRGLRQAPLNPVAQGPRVNPDVFTKTLAEQNPLEQAYDTASSYLSPSRASIQPPPLQDAVAQVKADYVSSGLKVPADDIVMASAKKLVTEKTPGFLTKYGPLAAVAGTTLAATGALNSFFTPPQQEEGESYEAYMARRKVAEDKFRQDNPQFFGSFLPQSFAKGSGPQGVEDFPRKNGAINGPGTGTSDDIPAMLSDGEFVFTAKSVRNMGGGSRRKGAAKMYKLMKMLEGGPVGKTAKA